MTELHLSGPQHRALWHKLAMIRDALGELRTVRDHARFIGAGSLSRRRDDAEATITLATDQLAAVLEQAAGDGPAGAINQSVEALS